MDLIDAIKNRKSIRKYKKDMDVNIEDIVEVLNYAQNSPSINNIRDYYFIISKDKSILEKVSNVVKQGFIKDSNAIVIFSYDQRIFRSLYGDKGDIYAIESLSALIENFLLLLQEKNLGGCWIGEFNENDIKNIFSIPDYIKVVAIVSLGIPDENPSSSKKKNIFEMVYFDKWGNKSYKPGYYPLINNISNILAFVKK